MVLPGVDYHLCSSHWFNLVYYYYYYYLSLSRQLKLVLYLSSLNNSLSLLTLGLQKSSKYTCLTWCGLDGLGYSSTLQFIESFSGFFEDCSKGSKSPCIYPAFCLHLLSLTSVIYFSTGSFFLLIKCLPIVHRLLFWREIYNHLSWDYWIRRLELCREIRLPNKSPDYDTKLHLMVRLLSWRFENVERTSSLLLVPDLHWSWLVVPEKVPKRNLQKIIIISYLKTCMGEKVIHITFECLIIRFPSSK